MRSPQTQRGISLISLMVGMVVSLTATVGMMAIYRNSLAVTTSAMQNSVQDARLNALLLRAGASIEDAGYGISGATFGTHLIPLTSAAINGHTLTGTATTAGTTANGVVWSMLTGTTTQCAGFVAPSTGALIYLQPTPCTNAQSWNTLAWTTTTVQPAPATPKAITFTFTQASCQPYGITNTSGSYTVTVASTNSVSAVNSLQCLINFQ